METNQVNPLLILFCKELTIQLESLSNLQESITPTEFSELISNATHEVLESYTSGEFDLLAYRGTGSEEYKELARRSIDSYSASNTKIGEITDKHAQLLNETATSKLIDFGTISEKFNAIQDHLNDEVSRANDVIHTLMEQVKTLEIKTSLDPLTKAYNRYALHEYLRAVLEKEKLDYDIFALMIDVDDFKFINDRFGHIAGDKVLIFIVKLFKKALRDGDRVYRFGGEEFIILLNRTDSAGAQLVAERLLNLCRNNKPLFQNQQIPVTLSIGLTKIIEGDTIDAIINRSDVALYRAKKNGKDRLEMEF
ncbi:GGDEF domain-containing protein [Sulfuricurvum sp.]|uniref:GGDEF domain-containing protein n=1 Tax=Sulfuricurvum sp. TaxID=2025608 RepID=UPI0026180E42|nr:GGDEF domain-containing protein [Sulfuricurvum sp.]MDD2267294.1 GGDEF domain-containing protein [Sulfuricurvum sp.]MDD2782595.1 GGDEF domain-containing protein [Sulfuricurvum sp.]